MPKTYVLLSNHSRSGRKDPYTPVVFSSMSLALNCKEVDPAHDFIFETAVELVNKYDDDELLGVCKTLAGMDNVGVPRYHHNLEMAKDIFTWTTKRAQGYSPASGQGSVTVTEYNETNELDAVVDSALENAPEADEAAPKKGRAKKAKAPKEPKAPKVKAEKAPKEPKEPSAPKHPRFSNDLRIVALLESPPIKEGSNRYRNMQTVINSATVGEALVALRALTPPGVPHDIDLAVEKAAIRLEE